MVAYSLLPTSQPQAIRCGSSQQPQAFGAILNLAINLKVLRHNESCQQPRGFHAILNLPGHIEPSGPYWTVRPILNLASNPRIWRHIEPCSHKYIVHKPNT